MSRRGDLPQQPILDAGWCMQHLDEVDLVVLRGRMTAASFDRFLAASLRSIDERDDGERVSLLHDVRDPVLVDGRWRRKLATELKRREQKLARTRPAHAIVGESILLRAALKVVHWIAPPKYPHVVVFTLSEACAFIAKHMPGLDPRALAESHRRLCETAFAGSKR